MAYRRNAQKHSCRHDNIQNCSGTAGQHRWRRFHTCTGDCRRRRIVQVLGLEDGLHLGRHQYAVSICQRQHLPQHTQTGSHWKPKPTRACGAWVPNSMLVNAMWIVLLNRHTWCNAARYAILRPLCTSQDLSSSDFCCVQTLLSSSTVLRFSIQMASTGPSSTIHVFCVLSFAAPPPQHREHAVSPGRPSMRPYGRTSASKFSRQALPTEVVQQPHLCTVSCRVSAKPAWHASQKHCPGYIRLTFCKSAHSAACRLLVAWIPAPSLI